MGSFTAKNITAPDRTKTRLLGRVAKEVVLQEVKEGFGNQINLCQDRRLNPETPAQKSDTLPLDHQVTS
uniref:Uncharacterized protein n=1 Tax=Timema poppense TaxID=170557 RepID=A0A7R9D1Y8_TIMPO|nr:unnamed protein product [Timema poppensis]